MNRSIVAISLITFLALPALAQSMKVYEIEVAGDVSRTLRLTADVGDHCAFGSNALGRQKQNVRVRFFTALPNNNDRPPGALGPILEPSCRGYNSMVVYGTWRDEDLLDLNFYFREGWAGARLFLVFETYDGPTRLPGWENEIVQLPSDPAALAEYFATAVEVRIKKPPGMPDPKNREHAKTKTACAKVYTLPGPFAVERLWTAEDHRPVEQQIAGITPR